MSGFDPLLLGQKLVSVIEAETGLRAERLQVSGKAGAWLEVTVVLDEVSGGLSVSLDTATDAEAAE